MEAALQGNQIELDKMAAEELERFISNSEEAKNKDGIGLRLKVIGGGCAGFQYSLSLDNSKEGDHSFVSEGMLLIVDEVSLNFVGGSTITYRDDIDARGFEVLNPRAVSACGCGSSFAMKD